MNINLIVRELSNAEHGFKHIIETGNLLFKDKSIDHFILASQFLDEESYQGRMLGTYILGILSPGDKNALKLLQTKVSKDDNWRVQEMLARAFDHYCKTTDYKH